MQDIIQAIAVENQVVHQKADHQAVHRKVNHQAVHQKEGRLVVLRVGVPLAKQQAREGQF